MSALLAGGWTVAVIDDLSTGEVARLAPMADRIDFIQGDIRDPAAVDEAVASADVVFHQAALPSVARSVADPRLTNDINTNGTIEVMLGAARAGVRRVVYASSSSIYGSTPELPRREIQRPDPQSPYAASKLAAEHYVHALGNLHGLETVALRYFNVFGPGQDPASEYAAVVPRFIVAGLNGESPHVHGDGQQTRDFTYIDNVVAANLLAATRAGSRPRSVSTWYRPSARPGRVMCPTRRPISLSPSNDWATTPRWASTTASAKRSRGSGNAMTLTAASPRRGSRPVSRRD